MVRLEYRQSLIVAVPRPWKPGLRGRIPETISDALSHCTQEISL